MILTENNITETNCTLPTTNFTIKASPIAFEILSAKLYSNPILAIVRELLTNAYDSQKAAGNEDTPIDVHIPTYMDKTFSIRDYGTGLSKEDTLTLYTTFFSSTKADTNDFTGCFGLGSKTPFAYTSTFTVTSYFNGIKYNFLVTKKDGYPSIILINEEKTEEPNGLQVSLSVLDTDRSRFTDELLKYIKYIPEIKINCNSGYKKEQPIWIKDNLTVYKTKNNACDYIYKDRKFDSMIGECVFIKQGQNVYPLLNDKLYDKYTYGAINSVAASGHNLIVEVPIGSVAITPNRETLLFNEDTITFIHNLLYETNCKLPNFIPDIVKEYGITDNKVQHVYLRYLNGKYEESSRGLFRFDNNNLSVKLPFKTYIRFRYGIAVTDKHELKWNQLEVSKSKSLIILLPIEYSSRKLNQIARRVNNYTELHNYNIYLCYIPLKELKYIRMMYKAVKALNNLEENLFNAELISINKFNRLYPNNKPPKIEKEKKEEKKTVLPKSIQYTETKICFNNLHGNNYFTAYTDYLNRIKMMYLPENTIISITDNNSKSDNANMMSVIAKLKTRSGDSILQDWLIKKGVHLLRSTNDKFWYIQIYASNISYFKKDYIIIQPEEILQEIKDYDWYCLSELDVSCLNYLFDRASRLVYRIENITNKKLKEKIQNSKLYTKLVYIKNIINKYNYFACPSTIEKQVISTKPVHFNMRNIVKDDMLKFYDLIEDGISYMSYSRSGYKKGIRQEIYKLLLNRR